MTLAVGANGQTVAIDASLWVLQGISGCFLGLRIYCKCYLRGVGLWYDDFFLLAAWVFLLVSCIATTINDTLGFGHHVQEIPIDNVVTMGILSNVSGTLSIIATAASKTSFAITLLRISNGFWMRTLIWFIIITLNITMNLSGIFFWVSCDPPQKTWDPLLPGTCWPETVSVYYGIVVGGKDIRRGKNDASAERVPEDKANHDPVQPTPLRATSCWLFCPGEYSYPSACTDERRSAWR